MATQEKKLTLEMVTAAASNIYHLKLGEFTSLEIPAFEALSPLKHYLNLSSIEEVSDEEAAIFARHPGILDLSGVQELSDAATTTLAAKQGGLWLNGLTTLTEIAAEALSKHRGDLYLWGLTALSASADKKLSKHNIFRFTSQIKISS